MDHEHPSALTSAAGTPTTLTPLQRLTALYVAGGYGRQSAQFAADLLAEHDAGKDSPRAESTLSSDVLDLLAAIRDAVDVPLPGVDDADERAYDRLMSKRLGGLHAELTVALSAQWVSTLDPAAEADYIRRRTAAAPVTYTVWARPEQDGGAR